MIETEAWVLREGPPTGTRVVAAAQLERVRYTFTDIGDHEVLAEPIYGSWEANMMHALERRPIDICRRRGEQVVVLGNAGVVRVLRCGREVSSLREGDICLLFCNGVSDANGYPDSIFAYDSPGTVGVLARQMKAHVRQLIPVPDKTKYVLEQWAAFSLRYVTAWANWRVAYGCWELLAGVVEHPGPEVWGWGGGVTFAELTLARHSGSRVAMISSSDERLGMIGDAGITPVDRRQFPHLAFDQAQYRSDPHFQRNYVESERTFLDTVAKHTEGRGVSIFVDFIGAPVYRASLKALARPGVITTAGWKEGMNLATVRALECMGWHIHVHTHYARYVDACEAVRFAESTGWLPPVSSAPYKWDSIPDLVEDYATGRIGSYFPVFEVNAL